MSEKPLSFTDYARHRGVRRQTVDQYVAEGKIDAGVHVNQMTGHKRIWRDVADAELAMNINEVDSATAKERGVQAHKYARLEKPAKAVVVKPVKEKPLPKPEPVKEKKAKPTPLKKEKKAKPKKPAPKPKQIKVAKPKPIKPPKPVKVRKPEPKPDEIEEGEYGDDTQPTPPPIPTAPALDSIVGLKRQESQLKIQKQYLELQKLKGTLIDKNVVQQRLFGFGQLIRDSILAVPDRVIDDLIAARTRGEAFGILMGALEDSLRQLSNLNEIELNENP